MAHQRDTYLTFFGVGDLTMEIAQGGEDCPDAIINPIYLCSNSVTTNLLVFLWNNFIESIDDGSTDIRLGTLDFFGGSIDGFSISLLGGA